MNKRSRLQLVLIAELLLSSLLLLTCKPKATPTPTPTLVVTPTPTPTPAGTPAAITFDQALARQARQLFVAKYVCNVCHSISALNMPGGTLGPDLSAVLLGRVPTGTASALYPLPRWFEEKGLARPEGDPVKAGELLVAFLASPPDYAPTKKVQVAAFKNTAGGEEPWLRDVKALVELFREASAKQ
ncbi:MAG: cytochrome C [Chloroflexi bacterium]|nr:cytochrome C [Chloroflexota bacterium]